MTQTTVEQPDKSQARGTQGMWRETVHPGEGWSLVPLKQEGGKVVWSEGKACSSITQRLHWFIQAARHQKERDLPHVVMTLLSQEAEVQMSSTPGLEDGEESGPSPAHSHGHCPWMDPVYSSSGIPNTVAISLLQDLFLSCPEQLFLKCAFRNR